MTLTAGDHLDFKDGHYTLTDEIHHGQTDIFLAERTLSDGSTDGPHVVKVGDTPNDEFLVLAELLRDADPKFPPYLPKVESMLLVDGEFAHVFGFLDGFYSLGEVRDHYPDGVDPRDMAWMFRRLLVALGFAHRAGYLHAAVLPQHVMIHPEKHGLVLIDWTHAVRTEEDEFFSNEIPVEARRQGDWYPHEVSHDPGSWTDLYMAANLMSWLMGGDPTSATLPAKIEREYRIFLSTLLNVDWRQRPHDAWMVLRHFNDLIERLYGKRRFRPFSIPSKGGGTVGP